MQGRASWSPPGGVLARLCEQAEIRAASLRTCFDDIRAVAQEAPAIRPFQQALRAGSTVQVIAEVKRRSPSKGPIDDDLDAQARASAYVEGGAAAISVLTEPASFGGSLEDLIAVSASVSIPTLRKDFHVDPVQVWESRAAGASAFLIIVRAVGPDGTGKLLEAASAVGVEALVEVRDETELDWALRAGARTIGVNRRNLETLALDDDVPRRLLPLIPSSCVAVAESGIASRAGVRDAALAGADAVLVGSALSGTADPVRLLRSLVGEPRSRAARHG